MSRRMGSHDHGGQSVAVVVVLLLGIATSGCGSTSTTYSTVAASVSTTGRSETTPASPTTLVGGSTDAVLVPAGGCCEAGPTVLLSKVTTEQLDGFDRIVFEFTTPVANYHVRYVPLPVKQDPSDQVVDLQGDSAIQVSMGATGLDQSVTPPKQVYVGPQRLAVGASGVIELVQTGDFEAVSNWALGVRGKPTFRVSTESNPSRLVIDVSSS